eukprot:symbB.v1.2.031728.t2/scaffold3716.1/size51514/2
MRPATLLMVAVPFILGIWAQRSQAPETLEDLDITKSRFCHGWSIAQLRKGYRYCADDILCAYLACQAEPDAKRMLDLGSGIGSIGKKVSQGWLATIIVKMCAIITCAWADVDLNEAPLTLKDYAALLGLDDNQALARMPQGKTKQTDVFARLVSMVYFSARGREGSALSSRRPVAAAIFLCCPCRLAWLAQQPTGASCTMLEAQEISVELCRQTLRSCEINAVDLRHGDLRDDQLLKSLGNFDVVTANPPYLPQRSGNLPDNSQKAHCRHELRGGISEFCSAAAQLISPHGSFCMIHAAPRLPDVLTALRRYDFKIRRRVEIFFRGNYKSVAVVCSPAALADSSKEVVETLHIIEEDGSWSPGYLEICAKMGL